MEFSGRVYFDIASGDSWRFYQLIARAFEERVQIRLEWRSWVSGGLSAGPLTGQERIQAAYEWVREAVPTKQGPFLQALFIAVHEENAAPGDAATIALAARLAGLDPDLLTDAEIDGEGRRLRERMAQRFAAVYDYSEEKRLPMREAAMDLAVNKVVEGVYARGFLP